MAEDAFTQKEAWTMIKAAQTRDQELRNHIAVLRYAKRHGVVRYGVTLADAEQPMWKLDGKTYKGHLETPNLVLGYIETISATTAAQIPEFAVEPMFITQENVATTNQIEKLLHAQLEKDLMLRKMRRIGEDAATSGDGWLHVQWKERRRKLTTQQRQQALKTAEVRYRQESVAAGLDDSFPEHARQAIDDSVGEYQVLESRPTAEYVSDGDVLLPLDISEVDEDIPWYCVRSIVRLRGLKNEEIYQDRENGGNPDAVEKVRARGKEDDQFRMPEDQPGASAEDPDATCLLYKFYDVQGHRLLIFAEGVEDALYDGDNPNDFEDVCLVQLRAHRDGERVRGFGDLENILGDLVDYNELRAKQRESIKNYKTFYATKRGALTDNDKQSLSNVKDGEVLELDAITNQNPGMETKLSDMLETVTMPTIPADVWNMLPSLLDEVNKIININDIQAGGVGSDRAAATTTALIDGVAATKSAERRENYEWVFARVAYLFLKYDQQYLTEEQVIRIAGPEANQWDEFALSGKDLQGQYMVRVRPASMAAINPATKAQRGVELVQQAMALKNPTDTYDVDGLLNTGFAYQGVSPELLKLTKTVQPPPPPAAPAPADPNAMPMDPGMLPDPTQVPPGGSLTAPDQSTQQDMIDAGGPALPGMDGMGAL